MFRISSDVDRLPFPRCLLIEPKPIRWHNQGSTAKVDGRAFLPSGLSQPLGPNTDISPKLAEQKGAAAGKWALLKAAESVGLKL